MPVWHVARAPEGSVYIGRGSRWGNPYRVAVHGRERAVALYADLLWRRIRGGRVTIAEVAELHGRDLACHCAPKVCHGDVLERAAAWAYAIERARAAQR